MKYRLGDLIDQIRGVSYKPTDLHNILDEDSVVLLRANNIYEGKINFDEVVYVDKTKVKEEQYLKKGDIFICASSGSKHLVGKAAYIDEDLKAVFGAFCKVVRLKNKKYAQYIGHYFNSSSYRNIMNNISLGSNINNIRNEDIEELKVNWYSDDQQHKIVAILDQVNQIISLRTQQLEQLDLLIKSRFVEMFGDPVLNEKGWEITNLINVAEIKIGPFGSLLHKEDYVYEKHALVNPSHIIDSKIVIDKNLTVKDEKYNELIPYHLKIGDVVLGRRGEMGRCAVVEENGLLCGTGSIIIRPNNKIKSYFLQKTLSNPVYKKILEQKAVGTTMPNLNVPIVSNLRIPLYPLALQNQFAAFVEEVEKEKATVKQSLEELGVLKNKLMQEYFG